jgi:hypothetical protein
MKGSRSVEVVYNKTLDVLCQTVDIELKEEECGEYVEAQEQRKSVSRETGRK